MDQQSNNQASPQLCRGGCGFWGSSAMDGMCSKCYKDALARKMVAPTSVASSTPTVNITASSPMSIGGGRNDNRNNYMDLSVSPSPSPAAPVSHLHSHMSNMISASMPVPSSARMAKPASDLSLASADSDLLSSSPSCSSLPGSFSDPNSPMSSAGKRNRCELASCNKRVGLTGFECRCGKLFCAVHRYSDIHNCDFDYKTMAAEQIRQNNPVVNGKKVEKL
ncbi:hypothetical protein RvY_04668 [Ramazzottius varieornatus]|uniref:A20-type domain-containing protein n=1 Tax=Ramazzottius varieornatus TaxID=947166 RepID=A0A1D1UY20_RAMVA|nr:hypothetical protein RvY_04668 [Ramazzottius varieornatus]